MYPERKKGGKNLLNGTSEVGPFSFICRSYPCHVLIGAPSRTRHRIPIPITDACSRGQKPASGSRQAGHDGLVHVAERRKRRDRIASLADARGRWTTAFVKREACLNKDATAVASFSSLMQTRRRSPASEPTTEAHSRAEAGTTGLSLQFYKTVFSRSCFCFSAPHIFLVKTENISFLYLPLYYPS